MTAPNPHSGDAPEELTPEARAVIGRARRSFGLSIAVLMVGFIAIALALVYRSARDGGSPADGYALGEIALPAGASVVSIVPSEGMIAVTYDLGGVTQLRLIDGKTGAVLRDVSTSVK
ncbi:MAG TPA: hypothetical protein VIL84_05065 [Devosiaceae bacterium]